MAHLYHVSMMHHTPSRTEYRERAPYTMFHEATTTYKDAFVKRSGPLEFGDDFADFREFLHKEFFPNHEHGPVILSLTDHGERPDKPEESTENKES